MKEADYINATNLAKLRVAVDVLRAVLPNDAEDKEIIPKAYSDLCRLVQKYEYKVEHSDAIGRWR